MHGRRGIVGTRHCRSRQRRTGFARGLRGKWLIHGSWEVRRGRNEIGLAAEDSTATAGRANQLGRQKIAGRLKLTHLAFQRGELCQQRFLLRF